MANPPRDERYDLGHAAERRREFMQGRFTADDTPEQSSAIESTDQGDETPASPDADPADDEQPPDS